MANWTDAFGGANVAPAQATYVAVELSANTVLVWPLESSGSPTLAGAMDVTPTLADLSLALPDATQGATGIACLVMTNPGNVAFTLTDTFGAQVVQITPGTSWTIVLQDNGTPAGAWEAIQLGATTSSADAGALAGYGLQAIMTKLQVNIVTHVLNVDTAIDYTYRASGIVWTGAVGTLQMDAIGGTLTAGWCALVTNLGTGALTLTGTGGDTINGEASITLPVSDPSAPYSTLIVAGAGGFYTFAGTPPIIPITGGGTGANTAGQALINLGGSTIGIDIFEAPNAAAILALLGIGPSAFIERTVATNQTITTSSINSAFVATAEITFNLPDSTDPAITNQFLFAAYAFGGNLTLSPVGGDKINNGTAGNSFVVPQGGSLILTTDGNGNWWPFFLYTPGGIPWTIATGTGDAMVAAYFPAIPSLKDGTIIGVRAPGANAIAAPQINVDTLGNRAITKDGGLPLVPNDIPGATAEILLRYSAAHTSWELYNPTINLDLIGATQGDILYRDASDWAALAPGTAGQILQSGGAAANPSWVTEFGRLISITTLNTAGSSAYAVPDGCTLLVVDVVGSGGGGAGASVAAAAHVPGGGAGGGGGAYTRGTVSPPATSYTVVVGAGGAGGVSAASGIAGGNTSFGALFVANGGGGGLTGTNPVSGEVGNIALPAAAAIVANAGAVIATKGQVGGYGLFQNRGFAAGGTGGGSPFGAGGVGGYVTNDTDGAQNGTIGAGPGGGGGGAGVYSNANAQVANGGNGADGLVIIYAYG